MPEHAAASRLWFSGLCFLLQILLILLFAVLARYSPEGSPGPCPPQLNCSQRSQDPNFLQPRFQDVHVQLLLSFGLLVAFLSRYGPGSAAIIILITAFSIQWAVLMQGMLFFFLSSKISVGAQSMVSADFCTAAVLISTGAVLGRVSPVQMLLLALLEVTLCTLNEFILLSLMGVSDSGGSLTVHTFGAYFGLMVSRVLYQPHKDKRRREEQQDKGHHKDVFAVVGTIYLWIFWPSFTSTTTVHHDGENWAVLNSYFSLVASTVSTFILSPVLYEESTPRMVQLQDATLAAMAVMGMAGEMLLTPFGALIAGFLVGLITPLGFRFFTPVLHSKLKIQDTCGVHNTHGLPGVLGALLGTLLTLLATADTFGYRLELVFPLVAQGSRTVTDQAFMQLSALPLTLLLATLGGWITGTILKIKVPRCCADTQYKESPGLQEVPEEGSEPSASGKEELGISTLV
ncbi:ammonium transporter Rh type B [Zonotrichia leucophrys gambelii]|uniref:ammonium transporter Rh type B n=1 Tax=Zonotrichia leucophrys gambelii TaxID=257770 RepID=UPI00313FFF7C